MFESDFFSLCMYQMANKYILGLLSHHKRFFSKINLEPPFQHQIEMKKKLRKRIFQEAIATAGKLG